MDFLILIFDVREPGATQSDKIFITSWGTYIETEFFFNTTTPRSLSLSSKSKQSTTESHQASTPIITPSHFFHPSPMMPPPFTMDQPPKMLMFHGSHDLEQLWFVVE